MVRCQTKCKVMVFAKAPIPGSVKTRLIPSIGVKSATELYEKLLIKTLETAVESEVGPVDLWCTPTTDHPFFYQCQKRFGIHLFQQVGGDLGERMAHAFRETFTGWSTAILIGSDCPSLVKEDLKEAARLLATGASAVLSPAEDGGYVLIGLSRFSPALFEGINWGSERVFEETEKRLSRLGWVWKGLSVKWDVDRLEDYERLIRSGLIPI